MVRINTSIESLTAQRMLNVNQFALNKTLERLSTGLRINRAADDAAGLAIGKKLETRSISVGQAIENIQMGSNYLQTTEGAMNVIYDNLQRIRELVLQAANDTNTTSDRAKIQVEINSLIQEIDSVSTKTEFNGKKTLQIEPPRYKELTEIPGSADISFVVDSSGSMGGTIATVVAGLAGFIAVLDAAGIDWNISVSEMGGQTPNNIGNTAMAYTSSRAVDFTDWTRTNVDLTMNTAAITNNLNDILGMMNGYGLGFKRVDPYNSMLEVASALYDTAGDPNAPAGLGIDRNGGAPGGAGDDFVTRRANTSYYQIVLADTIPESGVFTDGTHDQGGAQADRPSLPGVQGRDGTNMPLYGAVTTGGPGNANLPRFYGNQQREAAVAADLAAVGAMVFVVGNVGMNFDPGDGTGNRAGSTFYDDIVAATGGSQVNLSTFLPADLQPLADEIVAQSIIRPGMVVQDPAAMKVMVSPEEGGMIAIDQLHLTSDALGLVNIDVTNPGLNTDMENFWNFFDEQGNILSGPPLPPPNGIPPRREYGGTPRPVHTNPPLSPVDYTGYDDMIIQVDTAIERISEFKARFGAAQNAMEFRLNDLMIYRENLEGAKSRIMDADYGIETAKLTKQQILIQAGNSVVSQTAFNMNAVLQLLN